MLSGIVTDGVHKRPRRLTAGDRGLAQALQYEKPKKATTPKAGADVKPSATSLAAAMKRPKRVTAGLKGMAIAAENAKLTPRVSSPFDNSYVVLGLVLYCCVKSASQSSA